MRQKHWQRALERIRVLSPDIFEIRTDVKYLWGHIENLEHRVKVLEEGADRPPSEHPPVLPDGR